MELKQAKELVRGRLSDKRYEHTINVKKMAVKLAKHYGTDPEQAALAALLHDAAKELPKDEMRAIMQAYPQYAQGGEARPTPVWHGICAAILARTEWGVEDEAVLSAIACHTAGKPGMTRLDKILYLADMTSAERDWPGVEKLRKLEKKDLDAAMLAALKQTNDFVLSQGKPLDPMSKAAYEDILASSGQNEREGTAESKGLLPDAENGLQILPDNVILKTMTGLAENLLHDCENLEDTKKHEPDATPYQYRSFAEAPGAGGRCTASRRVQHGCKAEHRRCTQ